MLIQFAAHFWNHIDVEMNWDLSFTNEFGGFIIFRIAAELAAKKSRVKQSLIKRARSVAIFSLKLKERRAREAEKHAYDLAEQEKVCYKFDIKKLQSFSLHHFLSKRQWTHNHLAES